MLLRVIGDEPATMCLIGNLRGFPLHLARVMDLDLVFSWKSQGCPDTRISKSAVLIGIERDFDLDGALNAVRVFARSLCPLFECRQEFVTVEFIAFTGSTNKSVAGRSGEFRCNRSARTNIDRNRLIGFIINRRIAGLIILTLERDKLFCPKLLDQSHSFAQAGETLFRFWPFRARHCYLVERFTRANAQDHAAWIENAERSKGLRDNSWLVADRWSQDARAEHNAFRTLTSGTQPGENLRCVPISMPPGLEVITHPDAVETTCFSLDCIIKKASRPKLFCRRFITKFQWMFCHSYQSPLFFATGPL